MDRGVCYIALGQMAQDQAQQSIAALKKHNPKLPVTVLDSPTSLLGESFLASLGDASDAVLSRWAKVSLNLWSPYEYTLYLDADTRPRESMRAGFAMLRDEWDMVLAFSENQGHDWAWHVSDQERERTKRLWEHKVLQLQAGVVFFRKNKRMDALFQGWRTAWMQHRGEDQAALLRALYYNPVRFWLLGRPWNGGAVIQHLFGKCRGEA